MRKIYRTLLGAYLVVLLVAVCTPRPDLVKPTAHPIVALGHNPTINAAHHLLYYGGSFQWLGNFIMLIPLVFLLRVNFPQLKPLQILIIGTFTTIAIEFIQIYIPGRVSNVRDIVANSCGVATALVIEKLISVRKK